MRRCVSSWLCALVYLAGGTIGIAQTRYALSNPLVIERAKGFERRMHLPVKHPGNPLLKSDRPWESGAVFVNGGPAVIWDDKEKLFKIWYFTYNVSRGAAGGQVPGPGMIRDNLHASAEGGWVESFIPSVANSMDGLHWEKPVLGIERGDSKANNLLDWPAQVPQGGTNILFDPRDLDPRRRYKSLFYSHSLSDSKSARGLYVSFSRDGVHWNDYESNPVLTDVHDTHTIFGWDESSKKYVAYLRPKLESSRVRVIGRSESTDFIHWSNPAAQVVLAPDDKDPAGTEFYGMPVVRFDSMYYGLVWVYHNTPHWPWPKGVVVPEEQLTGSQQIVDTQLVTSPDGIAWQREGQRASFLPVGAPGEWDDGMVYPTTPIEVGDEIWIYYGGFNVRHTLESLALMGKAGGSRARGAGIGLARLRKDGFVSLATGAAGGELTTRPLVINGNALQLNADARGEVRVEIQDASGRPVSDFSLQDCQPVRGDSVRHLVHWKRSASLAQLAGRRIRLRMNARDADLYAFEFTETQPNAGAEPLRRTGVPEPGQSLEAAVEEKPGKPEIWNRLGVARDRAGDYPGAVEAFERAILLNPINPRTQFNLGHCHLRHGNPAAAVAPLTESLRLDPSQPRAHGDLAAAYAGLGKFQQASDHAAEQVRLTPDDAGARTRWGEILSNLGLFEKALAQFQAAASADPANALAVLRAGQTLKLLGRWTEAIASLQLAAKSEQEAEALLALGEIYVERGEVDEALPVLRRAADLNPAKAEVWYDLGRCKLRRGAWSEAGALLRRALELDADFAPARYQLARVYQELGESRKADEQYQVFRILEAREREQRKSMKRQY